MKISEVKKYLLVAGISAIGVTAFWSVGLVLFGTFSEVEVKFVLTTLVLGFYCLTFVATVGEGRDHVVLMIAGAIASIWGLWCTLPLIWWPMSYGNGEIMKDIIVVAIAAFAVAWGSINYRISVWTIFSTLVMGLANLMVAAVAWMLIWLTETDFAHVSESTIRMLIAFTILGVAGTIINPIVAKLTRT